MRSGSSASSAPAACIAVSPFENTGKSCTCDTVGDASRNGFTCVEEMTQLLSGASGSHVNPTSHLQPPTTHHYCAMGFACGSDRPWDAKFNEAPCIATKELEAGRRHLGVLLTTNCTNGAHTNGTHSNCTFSPPLLPPPSQPPLPSSSPPLSLLPPPSMPQTLTPPFSPTVPQPPSSPPAPSPLPAMPQPMHPPTQSPRPPSLGAPPQISPKPEEKPPEPVEKQILSSFKAAGDVSDYTNTDTLDGIRAVVAAGAAVPISAVSVSIAPGSVIITTTILVNTADEATSKANMLSSSIFASKAALESALSNGGVENVAVVEITLEPIVSSRSPSSPPPALPPSPTDGFEPGNSGSSAAVAAVAVSVAIVATVFACWVYLQGTKIVQNKPSAGRRVRHYFRSPRFGGAPLVLLRHAPRLSSERGRYCVSSLASVAEMASAPTTRPPPAPPPVQRRPSSQCDIVQADHQRSKESIEEPTTDCEDDAESELGDAADMSTMEICALDGETRLISDLV